MMEQDCITLTNMEFYGYHGCLPHERTDGQSFFVDAVLYMDLAKAGRSDCLEETVNYAAVYEDIRQLVEGDPVRLIECLAECIASVLLGKYPPLAHVSITVHKPSAPIPGKFGYVSVTLHRSRHDGE